MTIFAKEFFTTLQYALFNKSQTINVSLKPEILLPEATHQTVFPLVYSALEGKYNLSAYKTQYFSTIGNNVRVFETHKSIHMLFSEANIRYVFLKGCASARYYPDPLLRTMGDVDILISPEDTVKATHLLINAGYTQYSNSEDISTHLNYKSPYGISCELHRKINGIPHNNKGYLIENLFADIFKNSIHYNKEYYIPNNFHHGLILLIHIATHLTNEGVGLRHLCDWAVFIAKFNDKEFIKLFKKPLKEIGLWKFAQILSDCTVRYLGCATKSWIYGCESIIADALIEDILNSGNFGSKDVSRYQQIKYISNTDKTVTKGNPLKQLLTKINLKAHDIDFVKRHASLLPFGFLYVIFNYLYLVITKKRRLDNIKIINDATIRKKLYSKFELYK